MAKQNLKTILNFRKCTKLYAVLVLVGVALNWIPLLAPQAQATVPKYVNFQGKLTKVSDGTNVTNGSYAFEFKLYDASTSGTLLWTETYDQPSGACTKLVVTSGVFNAKLGSCASLSGIDFTGGSVYLSVNFAPTGVSYDGEMSPRKQLVASPFALVANGVSGDGAINTVNSSATALTVAKAGSNYGLQVDTSAGSAATGLKITSAAAASGIALAAISSGTNENITLDAKGTGSVSLGATSTGDILLGGGSGSTGCTVTNSTGAFACTAGGSFTTLGLTGAVTGATSYNGLVVTANTGVITTGTWNGTALTDAFVSDTLTSSLFVGSGSTTTAVDLATAEVAGILGAANGGTNNGFTAFTGPATSTKTFTLPNASATILTDNTLVTVAQGGTGAGTFTSNGVLYGNSTGAIQVTAAGTTGQCLTGNTSAAPSWGTCGTGAVNSGVAGYFGYYPSTGTTIDDQTVLFTNGTNIGIGDTTPAGLLTVGTGDLFQVNSSGTLTFSGVTTDITTGTNEALTIAPNGTGSVIISSSVTNGSGSGSGLYATSSTVTSGTVITFSSTSTAAAGNTQQVLNVSTSGTNATASQLTYGASISNTHGGTGAVNIALNLDANTGAANYALYAGTGNNYFGGNVGIGTVSAGSMLNVQQAADSANTSTPVAFDVNSAGATGELTGTAAQTFARIAPVVNQTGAGGYTALLVNATETATGSSGKYLLDLQTGGASKFSVQSDGTVINSSTIFGGGDIYASSTGILGFASRSRISSPADSSVLLTNAAANAFNLLQFGGTSSSFPALKRSTTTLQARLADDSGYTSLDASNYLLSGANINTAGTLTNVAYKNQVNAFTAAQNITSTSATALTVAASGSNYGLQVDESTVSAATGLKITPAAATGGIALAAISSGTNENLTLDAKGSGSVSIGASSTGDVLFGGGSGSTGCTVTNSTGAFACTAGGSFTTMTLTGAVTGAASYNGLVVTANTGVITTGTWNGTAVGATYGGTGLNTSASSGLPSINGGTWSVNTITQNGVAYGGASNAMSFTSVGTTGQCLNGNTAAAPTWGSCGGVTAFDVIGDPSGNGAINMGTTVQTLDWGATTTTDNLSITSSGTGVTSGSVLKVTSATTGAVSNGLIQFTASGAYTSTGGLLNVAANSTATGMLAKFSATGLTTGTGVMINGGTAMTTGRAFDVNTTSKYVHTTAETGNLVNFAVIDGSTIASGTSITNALNVDSTYNAPSGAGARQMNAINIGAPTLTACAAGTCQWTGVNINGPATTASYTSYAEQITANSFTTDTALKVSATSLTTGFGIDIAPGAGITSGAALRVSASGTSAIANGLVQITHSGAYTSTGGLLNVAGNSTTAGTVASYSATSLTTGKLIDLQVGANVTSGAAINIGASGTSAISAGLIQISHGGAYTGTGGLLNLAGATQTGVVAAIAGTSLTSGNALTINAGNNITSGSGLQITAGGTSAISSGLLQVTHSGAFTSTGGLMVLTGNSSTAGTLATVSGTGITTGTIFNIAAGAGITSGAALKVAASGTSAIANGLVQITHSGAYTSTGGLLNVTGNSTTAGTLAQFSATGLTTGTSVNVAGGTALTTGTLLQIGNGTYNHANGETGSIAKILVTDGTTTAGAVTSTTNGLNVATTVAATTSTSGTKTVNAINIASPTLTSCSGGASCVWNGMQITAPATTANFTSTALKVVANSLTTDTVANISATGQTSGIGLSITGGGANLTSSGKLIDLQMGAATVGAGLNILTSGVYTGAGLVQLTANSATSGVIDSISGTGLTSGSAVRVTGSGATMTTGGELVDLVLGANTVGAGMTITSTGAYTGVGAADGLINVVANSLSTGLGSQYSFTGLTSGSGMRITGSGATMTTGGELIDLALGANTAGAGITVTGTGAYTGTGSADGLINVVANSLTTGLGSQYSFTGQTSGSGIKITGGGANLLAGGKLIDLQMGAATVGAGLNILTSGVYTGAGLVQLTANSATSGVIDSISGTGITSGTLIKAAPGTAMTTGIVLDLGSPQYVHTGAETGSALSLNVFDASTNASGSAITNGALIQSTMSSSASAGSKQLNGLKISGFFTSCGTTGTSCEYYGVNQFLQNYTQSTATTLTIAANTISGNALVQNTAAGTINWYGTNMSMPNITAATGTVTADGEKITTGSITTNGTVQGINIQAGNGAAAGTLNGVNISNITPGAGAETAIKIGTGWDTGISINGTTGQTTQSAESVTGYSYNHTGTEAGSLYSLTYTDASSNASGTATTNGILLQPTINTTASAGAKVLNGISISPTLTACGTTAGTCTFNGYDVTTPALSQGTTNTYTIRGLNLGTAGALVQNPNAGTINWVGANIQMPNITQTTGSVNSTGLAITGGTVTSGTAYALTTSASAGNVGIGTTSPTARLHVVGTSLFALTSNTNSALQITDGTNNYFKIDTRTTTSGVSANTFSTTAPTIASASGTQYILSTFTPGIYNVTGTTNITGTGTSSNIGVLLNQPTINGNGTLTVTESSNLLINGAVKASSSSGTVTITNSYGIKVPSVSVNGTNGAVTNAYSILAQDPTGAANNYAAGFANSSGNVQIANDFSSGNAFWNFYKTDATKIATMGYDAANTAVFFQSIGADGLIRARDAINGRDYARINLNYTSGYITLSTNTGADAIERMRIDSTGAVGIGTSSPAQSNGLHLEYSSSSKFGIVVGTAAQYSTANAYYDGTNWRYITTNAVAIAGPSASGGRFEVYNAASGTAGTAVTLSARLTVLATGGTQVDLPGTTTTNGLCHATLTGTNDEEIVDCNATPSDVAEWYETQGDVSAGDIVTASEKSFTYTEKRVDAATGRPTDEILTHTLPVLKKSTQAYDNTVIGLVSTSPYQTYGEAVLSNAQHPQPIAVAGRVPVKISLENGSIHTGDFITSSATKPGYGMKATRSGQVLGQALSDFDGNDAAKTTVLVFIKPGYQIINNTFVLDTNDGQLTGQANGGTTASTDTGFLVNQKGSGKLLQVQQDGADRIVLNNNGSLSILSKTDTGFVLEVKNNSTSLFSIDHIGTARLAGTLIVKKDVAVLGRILGSTAIVGKNTSNEIIHQGDLLMLTGATETPALGDQPTLTIAKAVAGSNTVIVGIADRNLSDFNLSPDSPTSDDPTVINPGEFVSIVITGTYKKVFVNGSVSLGDKLGTSATPGKAEKLSPEATGQVFGISLDNTVSLDGSIRVMILSTFQQVTKTIQQVPAAPLATTPPTEDTTSPNTPSETETPSTQSPPTTEQ